MSEKEREMDDTDFLTLEFDNGEEIECEILGVFDFKDKEYIALLPDDGTDDIYIYGYKEVGEDEFELLDIDDDTEFDEVVAEFDRLMAEEIDVVDDADAEFEKTVAVIDRFAAKE